jgi:hypothetical protein
MASVPALYSLDLGIETVKRFSKNPAKVRRAFFIFVKHNEP